MNLSDSIQKELEELITSGFKPGDRIPTEMELAERFSVGRSTIRESMKAPVAKGLVARTTEGTFVSDKVNQCLIDPLSLMVNMEIGDIYDLLELREIIELGMIRIAAQKIDDSSLSMLKRINWQIQEPDADPAVLQERDIAFHSKIAESTGNQVLTEFLNAIRRVIVRNIENEETTSGFIQEAYMQHQGLIEALEEHNPDKAYDVLKKYFMFNADRGSYTRE